mmetsp:Transcript_34097/g.68737  ORF Transcript_34097/g.68737 Transcript_34097/m.68737 type:complete len:223 (-) Transcript_34097:257-925(-)
MRLRSRLLFSRSVELYFFPGRRLTAAAPAATVVVVVPAVVAGAEENAAPVAMAVRAEAAVDESVVPEVLAALAGGTLRWGTALANPVGSEGNGVIEVDVDCIEGGGEAGAGADDAVITGLQPPLLPLAAVSDFGRGEKTLAAAAAIRASVECSSSMASFWGMSGTSGPTPPPSGGTGGGSFIVFGSVLSWAERNKYGGLQVGSRKREFTGRQEELSSVSPCV